MSGTGRKCAPGSVKGTSESFSPKHAGYFAANTDKVLKPERLDDPKILHQMCTSDYINSADISTGNKQMQ